MIKQAFFVVVGEDTALTTSMALAMGIENRKSRKMRESMQRGNHFAELVRLNDRFHAFHLFFLRFAFEEIGLHQIAVGGCIALTRTKAVGDFNRSL